MENRQFNLRDISILGVWNEIKKHIFVMIVLGLAAFLMMTGLGKLTYKPEYQSRATLAISVKGYSGYSSLSMANNMASVFSDVFESSALQRKISEAAGENVEGRISCSTVSETNLLNLVATSSDSRQAYLYLQMALKNYSEVSGYVFSNAVLDIVQEPSIPMSPVNTSRFLKYRWPMVILVMLLVAGIAFLKYLLRFTVKTVAGAVRQLDGDILGVIHTENKHKGLKRWKKEEDTPLALTSSLLSMEFTEEVRMVSSQIEKHMRSKKQKIVLISSVTAHEGKSTISSSVAMALAERGKKVFLVDGDLRRPVQTQVFKKSREEKDSLTDVLQGKVAWEKAVRNDPKSGVKVLFQETPTSTPEKYMEITAIKELLQKMAHQADYVIVDTSPISVSREAEMWMQGVDTAVLVVRQEWSDIRAINDAVDLMWQNCGDFTGFVLNAFTKDASSGVQKGAAVHGK